MQSSTKHIKKYKKERSKNVKEPLITKKERAKKQRERNCLQNSKNLFSLVQYSSTSLFPVSLFFFLKNLKITQLHASQLLPIAIDNPENFKKNNSLEIFATKRSTSIVRVKVQSAIVKLSWQRNLPDFRQLATFLPSMFGEISNTFPFSSQRRIKAIKYLVKMYKNESVRIGKLTTICNLQEHQAL